MIKAVLFDLDGVLVDSETYDLKLTKDFIENNGYKTDYNIFKILIGAGTGKDWWTEEIMPRMHPDDDKEKFREEHRKDHQGKRMQMPFKDIVFTDTVSTLKQLKKMGLKLALCSSSRPEYIQKAVDDLDIRRYFDLIVSGHDFNRGKPFPDVYLYARDQFGLTSDDCVVVEDSTNGISAGKNALMRVIAKKDYNFGLDQSKADYFIDNLSELLEMIDQLNK